MWRLFFGWLRSDARLLVGRRLAMRLLGGLWFDTRFSGCFFSGSPVGWDGCCGLFEPPRMMSGSCFGPSLHSLADEAPRQATVSEFLGASRGWLHVAAFDRDMGRRDGQLAGAHFLYCFDFGPLLTTTLLTRVIFVMLTVLLMIVTLFTITAGDESARQKSHLDKHEGARRQLTLTHDNVAFWPKEGPGGSGAQRRILTFAPGDPRRAHSVSGTQTQP